MTRHKFFKRLLPIILSAMLLFSVLPVSASANNESTDEVASKIVREVVELREESVKHFLCEDGSYIAVSYAEPVHYEKNGEWLEIDNTLVLSSENTYVPKSSDVAVSIPQNFSGGKQITATNKGHTISFGVASDNENVALTKTATVKAVETLPSSIAADVSVETLTNAELSATATVGKVDTAAQIEAYNSEKTTVDNQAGALVYDKIFLNADLEYIVTGNSIKENIVVYQPQKEYVYTFDMDFGGLTPVAQEDGSYRLIDSAKPDETVFVLAAPYMYDANGEESCEVEMSLTQNGDNYLLTLTADEEWINNSERAFPVVIDPTLNFEINDVFVIDGLYANSPRVKEELRVGRNLTNLTRTYIKPTVPTIPVGSVIDTAYFTVWQDYYYQAPLQDDIYVRLYDCYYVDSWSPDSISWNNQPFDNSDNGYKNVANSSLGSLLAYVDRAFYQYDITETVKRWLETGDCEGLMLASSDETSKTQVDLHSSRSSTTDRTPKFYLSYELPHVSIDQLEFNSPDAATSSPIHITTSKAWTITVDQPWISVSATSGTGSSTFTISVTENTGANQREGTVTVWMGSVKIGEIKVYQSGSGAYLFLDETPIFIDYKTYSKTVTIDTNDSLWGIVLELWNNTDNAFDVVDIDDNNKDINAWLEVKKGTDKIDLTVRNENTEAFTRKARITVTAQSDTNTVTKTIQITQYDKVTCLFNTINADGTLSAIISSEYNHALATWAMELSYAAYNPILSQFVPGIPSSFIQEPFNEETKTAEIELKSVGFDATAYNYEAGAEIYAAHTIGYRNVIVENNIETEVDNNDTSITNDVLVWNSGRNTSTISSVEVSIGDAIYQTDGSGSLSSSETSVQSSDSRPLVVVVIRGSVTFMDWAIDIGNQFNAEHLNFQAGMKEVIKSLYGCTELCDDCNGAGCANASAGYLDGIENPIILITGHSLGAAIANLTADYLNQKLGKDNVYAYTFATPNTVNIANGDQAEPYENIFNFLNNNDAVPHFPWDLVVNEWARHGRDFHITMPLANQGIEVFDIDLLGAYGHGMPTYYAWLNNLPGELKKPAEDITVDDLNDMSVDFAIGLGALLFKVLCPVTVTLYDTDGSIIPFESQQDNAEYPKISDVGIVSWITDDGGKMFLIPYGTEDIEARIEAYDYGTMTLTVEQPGIGEPLDTITYNNVNLYPEKEFKVEIAENFDSEDVALVQVETDENGNEIETEITELDSYLKSVTVDDPEITYGTSSTFTIVTDIDAVKIQFIYTNIPTTWTLTRDHANVINLVEDGDKLIWTVQKVFMAGNHVFDFGVKMGSTWYVTENVIALTVT